jgi:hypothetical protein
VKHEPDARMKLHQLGILTSPRFRIEFAPGTAKD